MHASHGSAHIRQLETKSQTVFYSTTKQYLHKITPSSLDVTLTLEPSAEMKTGATACIHQMTHGIPALPASSYHPKLCISRHPAHYNYGKQKLHSRTMFPSIRSYVSCLINENGNDTTTESKTKHPKHEATPRVLERGDQRRRLT